MLVLLRRLLLMSLNPRRILPSLLGFLVGTILLSLNHRFLNNSRHSPHGGPKLGEQNLILVGVMTAQRYLDTRALEIWRTWARRLPGQLLFFVAEGTRLEESVRLSGMPIVILRGVDDAYPPQRKSFAMLRWMFDNKLAQFHWFMRADDDLYVRGDKLKDFLLSLDPDKAHLLGQAGLGNSLEYGQLSLGVQDNYCMGGPGVILSRESLRQLAPHLESCLGQLLTSHEDVELGRCIRRYVGLACPWNYEMQTLFHNNLSLASLYAQPNPPRNGLLLRRLITLHPVKQPEAMHRIHLQAEILRLREMWGKRMEMVGRLEELDGRRGVEEGGDEPAGRGGGEAGRQGSEGAALSSGLIRRRREEDVPVWEFISADSKLLFCAQRPNCPRHTLEAEWRRAITAVVVELFDQFNGNARQRGRTLHFQALQYGYVRVRPRFGVDLVLDMALWYRRFRGPNRTPLAVRRHAYVQQRFGPLQSRLLPSSRRETIHIVVALKGRAKTFARLAQNLVELSREDGAVRLVLVLYSSPEDGPINATIRLLLQHVPLDLVQMSPESGEFSRGEALSAGAALLPVNSLMFFADVDVLIGRDALHRIRLNTDPGKQVYFPIVFSQFSPRTWNPKGVVPPDVEEGEEDHFVFDQRRGYFRHFGFGLVSIYRADFDSIGGFNLTIQGWGLEDVDLFERVVKATGLQLFRAPDPALVHVFHPIDCAAKPGQQQSKSQKEACEGSRAQSMASLDFLAEHLPPTFD